MGVARLRHDEVVYPALARERRDDAFARPARSGNVSQPPRMVLSVLLHGTLFAVVIVFLRTSIPPSGVPEQFQVPMVFEANRAATPAAVSAPAPTPPVPASAKQSEPQPAVVPPAPAVASTPPAPVPQPVVPPVPSAAPLTSTPTVAAPQPDVTRSDTANEVLLPVPPLPPSSPPPRRSAAATRTPASAAPSVPRVSAPAAAMSLQSEAPTNASGGAPAAVFAAARPVAGMASDRPPTYPEIARRRGEQGRAVLRVSVGPDGLPHDLSVAVSSGFPVLDSAALAAVRNWRFIPATRNGAPVGAIAEVPVLFRLENP